MTGEPPPRVRPPARWSGAWTAFAVALGVQLVVLYAPRSPSPPTAFPVDKVVHLLVFAAVAWTGLRVVLPVVPLGAALVAHAGLSELLQAHLLPGRSGDPADVLADLAGVAVGLALGRRRVHPPAAGARPRSPDPADDARPAPR